ncbi:MAG: type II toxin-antitoxin system HicA family toxin [Prevotella sp.]|nr:type II toxin-antitoxin system HicA family toxin [Prevotella sp.]
MKAYKVIEVIKMLEVDGWVLVATKGDHRQYKHPQKKGKVTIRGHKNELNVAKWRCGKVACFWLKMQVPAPLW